MPDTESQTTDGYGEYVGFGRFRVRLPSSRPLRIMLGIGLCLGGFLWFLPVLGLWMLPLGIIVLAVDVPMFRPLRDRFNRWLERLASRNKKP